jgi:hypothetical protein
MTRTHGITHYTPDTCFGCRVKTVGFPATNPTFVPHFNHAVGRYVTSDRDFRDALKVCAEVNSVATGMDHCYEPRYPADMTQVPYPEADGVLEEKGRIVAKAMGS